MEIEELADKIINTINEVCIRPKKTDRERMLAIALFFITEEFIKYYDPDTAKTEKQRIEYETINSIRKKFHKLNEVFTSRTLNEE